MCGHCGLLGVAHWSETAAHPEAFTGAPRRTPRAERLHRIRVVNAMLAPVHMRVADSQGAKYVPRTATGRSVVLDDLAALWAAVERLRGAPLDPLEATSPVGGAGPRA